MAFMKDRLKLVMTGLVGTSVQANMHCNFFVQGEFQKLQRDRIELMTYYKELLTKTIYQLSY